MASAEQLSELLVHCCSMGDPHTLRQVRTEYPQADFNMTTEGGVTLLMHTIIGASMYKSCSLIPSQARSQLFPH